MRDSVEDDLACGCPTALPLVGGLLFGAALTAGWMLRTAWTVMHRVESRAWARSTR